jgi:hypothetical protein
MLRAAASGVIDNLFCVEPFILSSDKKNDAGKFTVLDG